MISVGALVLFYVGCPECGKSQQQRNGSEFFIFCCQNEDCAVRGCPIVVERKSGLVISVEGCHHYNQETENWEQLFPALFDKDGRQVWPKLKDKH
jgi:ssDNA-binding Zn-finger/Zn-ribbon topoisomerase 1